MVTQTIKVDLTKDIITDHIIFKQGEIGREIEFEVYNDGVAVDLDGYDVTFSIYKPDGNFVIVSGTIDNDTVTIEETEQMTAVCGSGCFDLALTKTNEVIYTFKGFVDIATPIVTRASVNSVSTVFGLVFPDDFQEKLTAGENITIVGNVISASGGGGGSYTAGDYISILNNVIDVKSSLISTINGKADTSALNGKQDKLTAGTYIDIDASNNIDVKSSLISTINGKADTSALNGKQDKLTAGTYIDIDASNNIDVKSSLISTINGKADTSALNEKQDKLTAGTGITIDSDNVISALGGGGGINIDFDNPSYTFNSNGIFLNSGYRLAQYYSVDVGLYYFVLVVKMAVGFTPTIGNFDYFLIGDTAVGDTNAPFREVYLPNVCDADNVPSHYRITYQGFVRHLQDALGIYTYVNNQSGASFPDVSLYLYKVS